MGHKNKVKPKGIGELLWTDVNEISIDKILQSVKDYCAIEDGSIPSDSEISTIQNLAQNSFIKLIYAAAHDEGYNSF
jgi:hypothetical protein